MMEIKTLGSNQIVWYQQFLIAIGILSVLTFAVVTIVESNIDFLIGTILIALFFLLMLALYSKLYNVTYDDKNFYLKNLFKNSEEKSIDFIEIKNIPFVSIVFVICFKNRRYYFMRSSEENYSQLFTSNKRYVSELTKKIKDEINLNPNGANL